MVLGNLIQLNSVGHEDRYLYGNPQMTYFKSVYKRASNFAVNYSKVPFIGNVNVKGPVPLKVVPDKVAVTCCV